MTSKSELASKYFAEGFNCAQSVFAAHAGSFGVLEEDALRIASGFGAGMGRLQEVCGAVSGACMVIGCRHGMVRRGDTDAKERTYSLVQQFSHRFRELEGSIVCAEILGCNLNTEEGRKEFKDRDLGNKVCARCVRDASKIVEEMLELK